ncbi:hypothetical protein [Lacrimispora defluvii]|jgi:hypothetical protein|uniref:Uncharacterized protein n=1 Tax=Lacrimispora defluvii TaxID=2719233 RepID=A0ABX1VT62_9FIRM|nr:hypothetical protein [Lacrimispora defluvii]MBE5987113.1 hypothetical protein [Paenibacillaceae bacterium]NNJ31633.1 hypothetical protein [Lacrimispora defluvii]
MNNPLLTEAIGVHFLDMDSGIEEQVICNTDGSFTIIINSRLNQERQMQAYQHALRHIANDDFNKKHADSVELAM